MKKGLTKKTKTLKDPIEVLGVALGKALKNVKGSNSDLVSNLMEDVLYDPGFRTALRAQIAASLGG